MYTDLSMALREADELCMKYRKDFVLTYHDGKYHVLEHGSGYNNHTVVEVVRTFDWYAFPRESR